MIIIDKVEIKYFRSFLDKKVEILNMKDLNILSGKNDCGKSNVLRALNLFFNFETDLGKPINFQEDFSKFRKIEIKEDKERRSQESDKEIREQRSFISIKVHFDLSSSGMNYSLPDRFWISRTWKPRSEYNRPDENDNIVSEYKRRNKGNLKKGYEGRLAQSKTILLSKIKFEYIPAIKDRTFQNYLLGKLQETILSVKNTNIVDSSKSLENELTKAARSLYSQFENETGIKSNLKIPDSLIDFFQVFQIYTQLNNAGEASPLENRGDGIQARFIPTVLEYVSENSNYSFVIWGFEEPENSYEYTMASSLAQKFKDDFSKKNQIIITTHSFIFLSLQGDHIAKYRVYNADPEKIDTQIVEYNNDGKVEDNDILQTELGVLEIFSQIKQITDEKISNYEKQIKDLLSSKKPIIYTEGPSDVTYLEYAWSQIESKPIPYEIKACGHENADGNIEGGYDQLRKNLEVPNHFGRKIIGLFDNDNGFNAYNGLKNSIFTEKNEFSKCNIKKTIIGIIIPKIDHRINYHLIHELPIEALFEDNTLERYGVTLLENKKSIKNEGSIIIIDYKKFTDFKKTKLAKNIKDKHTMSEIEKDAFKKVFQEINKYIEDAI